MLASGVARSGIARTPAAAPYPIHPRWRGRDMVSIDVAHQDGFICGGDRRQEAEQRHNQHGYQPSKQLAREVMNMSGHSVLSLKGT
jgi:hypothetical protein